MKTINQLRIENALAREKLEQLKAIHKARLSKKVTLITKSSVVIERVRLAVQSLKDMLESPKQA